MAIITATRPDPKYYVNIQQLPDLTWSSDQMPLDDLKYLPPAHTNPDSAAIAPGLRTLTASSVYETAANLIAKYATADVQRDALTILATTSSGTPWTQAKATMDWITAVNVYRDTQVANVYTLNFNQLVAYVAVAGVPPWPSPPTHLVPGP
jgi:hypothetical protein